MRKTLVVGLFALPSVAASPWPLGPRAASPVPSKTRAAQSSRASPSRRRADALIEKVRSAVTDSSGNYRIVDLPPGTYSVAFTLTGFKTVRREGVMIQGTFAAPVSTEMQVGALEETIRSRARPTVDVSNNTSQFVVDRDILDQIPTPVRKRRRARCCCPAPRSHHSCSANTA